MRPYKTAPVASPDIPDVIPFIIASEAAERFSYSGMRAIQVAFMMKSFIMAFYFLAIAAGNLFTGAVNFFIQNTDGASKLQGAFISYFLPR